MTRNEFYSRYLVEPMFERDCVFFYVYKNDKVDYITPAIQLHKAIDLECFDDKEIKQEIIELAHSFISEKYGLEDE